MVVGVELPYVPGDWISLVSASGEFLFLSPASVPFFPFIGFLTDLAFRYLPSRPFFLSPPAPLQTCIIRVPVQLRLEWISRSLLPLVEDGSWQLQRWWFVYTSWFGCKGIFILFILLLWDPQRSLWNGRGPVVIRTNTFLEMRCQLYFFRYALSVIYNRLP